MRKRSLRDNGYRARTGSGNTNIHGLKSTDIHGLKSESGPVLHIVGYSEQFYFSFCSLYVVIVLINILTDSVFLSTRYLIITYI